MRRLTIALLALSRAVMAQTADAPVEATAPSAVREPGDATREAAERYDRGVELYSEGDYALAAIEFERAYSLTSDYRVLYNIGQVRIQLGNYATARGALERYLKEGGDNVSVERQQAISADLQMIASRTATVSVVVNIAGASVSVDDDPVGTSPLAAPLVLDLGSHRISARKPGFSAADSRLTLAGGDATQVQLEMVADAPVTAPVTPPVTATTRIIVEKRYLERSDRKAWLWATWSATGVFAVGGITLGALGLKAADDLDQLRVSDQATRAELDTTQRRARNLLVAADLLGGAAIASGGVALYLTLSTRNPSPARHTSQRNGVHVGLVTTPNWIGLRGNY